MGLFSRWFGKNDASKDQAPRNETLESEGLKRKSADSNVVDISTDDDRMNWAMEKAGLTLHYFESCLAAPKPGQDYFSIKVMIVDGSKVEHIWLNEPSFDDEGNLFGKVGNEPIDVSTVSLNQKIGIDKALVSDWMIIEKGRLIGGYTIRAMRDRLSGPALENFDKGLGGIFVDEGEDYFEPSDETPEGAIAKIEAAFDADDFEGALACKDFNQEAVLMVQKMGKSGDISELVTQTAEVLRLSFIKSLQENGMPQFGDLKRAFPKREKVSDKHMIITEICTYPDGFKSEQRLNTFKTEDGWKVLHPEN